MDDNTSIQFRLRLAQINGINMNEEQINEKDLPKSRQASELGKPEPVKTNTKPSSKNNMNNPPVHNQPSHVNEVVKSSGLTPKEPATEDQRAPTLKTYHTAMAKYSHLPPPTAHINALNDTIDKHGSENADQHVTRYFYAHMQKHLGEEHINEAYNAKGKITHIVPKHKLDNHKKEMGFQGFDVETKPLPPNHHYHETHIGIVSRSPTESSHHMGAGAMRSEL